MSGKFHFLIFACFCLSLSCAKPNYQDLKESQPKVGVLLFPSSGVCADLQWEKRQVDDESSFYLKFYRDCSQQEAIDAPGDLKVRLWMPSMNHGSAPVEISKEKTGVYHITNVYFIMPGLWEIQIQIGPDPQSENLNEQVQI